MKENNKPIKRPARPYFSSGPCAKMPNWSLDVLKNFEAGRSHRAKSQLKKLQEVLALSREILNIPDNYELAIVPASDTGAVEMALWNLLGERGVDVLAWEVFGKIWVVDILSQLRLRDVRVFEADFGEIADLDTVDSNRDIVFTWNGTTSGVKVPNGDWIATDRKGVTICDATSAVFAMELPWDKLDVVTWSWQKVLGGEAGHGMIALSPRAIARLESFRPKRPLPKIFRLTKNGKFMKGVFEGKTINTPSMLAVEDCLVALNWAKENSIQMRSEENLAIVENWVAKNDWIDFLPVTKDIRSCTSICLKVVDSWFLNFPLDVQWEIVKEVQKILEDEAVGYDFANHRDSVPGFRIWGGGTVEKEDIGLFLNWLNWAYIEAKKQYDSKLKECVA